MYRNKSNSEKELEFPQDENNSLANNWEFEPIGFFTLAMHVNEILAMDGSGILTYQDTTAIPTPMGYTSGKSLGQDNVLNRTPEKLQGTYEVMKDAIEEKQNHKGSEWKFTLNPIYAKDAIHVGKEHKSAVVVQVVPKKEEIISLIKEENEPRKHKYVW